MSADILGILYDIIYSGDYIIIYSGDILYVSRDITYIGIYFSGIYYILYVSGI